MILSSSLVVLFSTLVLASPVKRSSTISVSGTGYASSPTLCKLFYSHPTFNYETNWFFLSLRLVDGLMIEGTFFVFPINIDPFVELTLESYSQQTSVILLTEDSMESSWSIELFRLYPLDRVQLLSMVGMLLGLARSLSSITFLHYRLLYLIVWRSLYLLLQPADLVSLTPDTVVSFSVLIDVYFST